MRRTFYPIVDDTNWSHDADALLERLIARSTSPDGFDRKALLAQGYEEYAEESLRFAEPRLRPCDPAAEDKRRAARSSLGARGLLALLRRAALLLRGGYRKDNRSGGTS